MAVGFRKVVLVAPPGQGGTYLREAVKDSIVRGEAPFTSHSVLLSTDDMAGGANLRYVLACLSVWMMEAEAAVFYADLGAQDADTRLILQYAQSLGLPVEQRSMPEWRGMRVSGIPDEPDPASWAT